MIGGVIEQPRTTVHIVGLVNDGALRSEVQRHHAALVAWLANGEQSAWADFARAHADEFSLLSVDGRVLSWPELSHALASAGGSQPELSIVIDRVEVLAASDDLAVVRFCEVHHDGDNVATRWTSAVLRPPRRGQPDVLWVAVHETAGSDAP